MLPARRRNVGAAEYWRAESPTAANAPRAPRFHALRFWSLGLLTAQTILLGGCVTSKVWEEGQFARFHEPARPPNLLLFHSDQRGDVLVEYDEWREGDESTRRRAYWLGQNTARLQVGRKPQFVPVQHGADLAPIPAVAAPLIHGEVAAERGCAVISNQTFVLYTGENKMGAYELPVYRDASGRVKQVAITPLAVAADLTIVGGFLFVWAWSSGWLNCVH